MKGRFDRGIDFRYTRMKCIPFFGLSAVGFSSWGGWFVKDRTLAGNQ
ncbi:hypothetical protein LI019_07145 [Enterocloster bolteae]|nr:hypothetical protein [Clostridium sp. 1001283B150225_161107_B6]MCB7088708.1 hypothetical protein [Enterocloster bolteae]